MRPYYRDMLESVAGGRGPNVTTASWRGLGELAARPPGAREVGGPADECLPIGARYRQTRWVGVTSRVRPAKLLPSSRCV
jgi:hypothetical protein